MQNDPKMMQNNYIVIQINLKEMQSDHNSVCLIGVTEELHICVQRPAVS